MSIPSLSDNDLIESLARQVIAMQYRHTGSLVTAMRLARLEQIESAHVLLVMTTQQEAEAAKQERRSFNPALFIGQMTAAQYNDWDPDDRSVLTPINEAACKLTPTDV